MTTARRVDESPWTVGRGTAAGIVAALRLLDARLSAAAEAIKVLFGPESTRDMFRGLHITPADVDRSLGRTPVVPLLGPLGFEAPLWPPEALRGTRFDRLCALYGLSPFDLDVLLLAVAPEIDARYERIYAFIQDDVTRKRPTVDLALNVLSASVEEKLARLQRFSTDAPLVRNGLVRVLAEGQTEGSRLGASLRLDEAVLGYLLGHEGLDGRVASCCRVLGDTGAEPVAGDAGAGATTPAAVYLQTGDLEESLAAVRQHVGGRPVLALDVERALWSGGDWDGLLAAAFRSALLRQATILVHRADLLLGADHRPQLGQLHERIAGHQQDVYLDGRCRWEPANPSAESVIELDIPLPSPKQSAALWTQSLARHGREANDAVIARLGATFPTLRATQIAGAVLHAVHHGGGDPGAAQAEALFEGARAQTRGALRGLAERVSTRPSWDELVVPDETLARLREIALRITRRATVMDEWGFAGRKTYGRGTTVLFAGPSGTGKTFAATVLAAEIGQDLYRIDLAQVVSKYIGETEKKLAQVFDGAERANCVLLFDEADALFGKRSEVHDAHDRYANQEVAYLLQRVERFGGLAILTTNLSGAIDEAFSRRLGSSITFDLPDVPGRSRLWERALPADAPRDGDLDLALLARELRLSGGVISKAALAAAFLAAEEGTPIATRHLLRALRQEVSSLGIAIPPLLRPMTS